MTIWSFKWYFYGNDCIRNFLFSIKIPLTKYHYDISFSMQIFLDYWNMSYLWNSTIYTFPMWTLENVTTLLWIIVAVLLWSFIAILCRHKGTMSLRNIFTFFFEYLMAISCWSLSATQFIWYLSTNYFRYFITNFFRSWTTIVPYKFFYSL